MIGKVEPLPPSTAQRYLREEQRSMGVPCALINAVRLPAEGVDLITYSVQARELPGETPMKMFEVRWSLRTTRKNNRSRTGGIVYTEIKRQEVAQ